MYVCELYDIEITQTAPFTSPLCCIEFKWQDAKAWAANPRNQGEGRSCAQVLALCRQKWYDKVEDAEGKMKDPIHPSVWIKHCHGEMNKKIEEYAQLNVKGNGVSLLRGTIDKMTGVPSATELLEWKRRAGMMRGVRPDENDLELNGDENYAPDYDGEEMDVGDDNSVDSD
jgi:hypothetical protein